MEPLSQVQTSTYSSKYYLMEKDLLLFDRDHHWAKDTVEIDVFGRWWSLAFGTLPPRKLAIGRHGHKVEFEGDWCFFIPRYGIMEWHMRQGSIQWQAFMSQIIPPLDLPLKPVAFRMTRPVPFTASGIFAMIQEAKDLIPIGKEEEVTAVAAKAKAFIDQTYAEGVKVADVAKALHVSHAVMTRAFHKAYGLSPVTYRNKLRVFDSLRLLSMDGMDVAAAGHQVGFGDISRFHKQFRREMNTVASHYRFIKK